MSVQYKGISHCILGDTLVLHCGMQGKIFVDSSYENYYELWSQIIINSEQANPRVVIQDNVRKRMAKGK